MQQPTLWEYTGATVLASWICMGSTIKLGGETKTQAQKASVIGNFSFS